MLDINRSQLTVGLLFFASLGAVFFVYSPGLHGPFIFDDYNNLSLLGAFGTIDNWHAFLQYSLSGIAGPTGRPLSLISFLIDANSWPAPAYSFKYTNVLIHLLNGVLVFWACICLLAVVGKRDVQSSPHIYWAALIATLMWLLHPYFVSTTLYVVQRMAQLPLLFSLVAIILYIKCRALIGTGNDRKIYVLLSLILPALGMLAALSKENGALLPVLLLVIEATIFKSSSFQRLNKYWYLIYLKLPFVLVIVGLAYLATKNGWNSNFPIREFTPVERLMTEFRVVWVYLYHLFVPHLYTTGVFHDTFNASSGLFSPVTTVIGGVGVLISIVLALVVRCKAPLVSLAILFFFASQLVESTTVGLELMFEHRTYLGSVFLFLPLTYYGFRFLRPLISGAVFSSILLLLAAFCWYGATLWSSYPSMAMVWATKMPDSPRAQVEAAKMLYDAGQGEASLNLLEDAVNRISDDLFLDTTYTLVKCRVSRVTDQQKSKLLSLAETELYRPTYFNLLQNVESWSSKSDCQGLDSRFVIDYVDALLEQPRNNVPASQAYAQLYYIKGVSQIKGGELQLAMASFERSLSSRSDPQKLMNMAAYLATNKVYDQSLDYALKAREQVLSGGLRGRALAEAPRLTDINEFIATVRSESANHE
ncbi:tetratricopeptide repeat protein [Marinobacter sp. JSM 1782161]|uniref:tetratricopeptide repeat protein n=1 Tax=Marinobacter sp. JSM 1782161 TaxID=2685906 RepID=UPI001402D3F4|nr:tetratricopeptide repeat protein [Marinobacter sp. JSM 1782161]